MKIAIIDNIEHPVDAHSGFGVEIFTYQLVQGLIKAGQDVTLFASGDSVTDAKLESVHSCGTALDKSILPQNRSFYQDYIFSLLEKNIDSFDIIHSQDHIKGLLMSYLTDKPVVSTFHDVWSAERTPTSLLRTIAKNAKKHVMVAISENQKKEMEKDIENVVVIPHGIMLPPLYDTQSTNQDKILFLGRINARKGPGIALEVANKTNKRLSMYGFTHHPFEKELLDSLTEQYTANQQIIFHNPIQNEDEKMKVYTDHRALIFPIQWEEPFGLVQIESMACGTPVIAYARGSVPEVIKDGETGFIVNSSNEDIRGDWIIKKTGVEGLCEAVERIYAMTEESYKLMRQNCRMHVEKNFTVQRMVNQYKQLYDAILNK
ncbi:MAG: glycosyltransferase [Candidatus Roizmanbacteria bacterium]|nr:glycosyltransferase [Candidatus Roizmanbacteria bacterium]